MNMQKIYMLEKYIFEQDRWVTIGGFATKEEAEKEKKRIEKNNKGLYAIFETNLKENFRK